MSERLEANYNLPKEVIFCKRCVMSNQRPTSSIEFKHTAHHKHKTLQIDKEGVCDACRVAEQKEQIDWDQREEQLRRLLDKYRRKDGSYDCIVPGSGGKDSCFAAHILKYKYGMHPLTVTWPPAIYTDIGWRNFRNWIEVCGVDNIAYKPNGRVHRLLTRLAFENLLHPFQPFILGQKNLAPKIAMKFGVPLVFYGENEAEYGNPIADTSTSLRDRSYFTTQSLGDIHIGGVPISELVDRYKLSLNDIQSYLPADYKEFEQTDIEVRYLGYYIKWTPQEAYYMRSNTLDSKPTRFGLRELTANIIASTTVLTGFTTTQRLSSSGWGGRVTMLHKKSETGT